MLTYKHKTHAVDSAGKIMSNADVDFFIDDVRLLFFKCFFFILQMHFEFGSHGMSISISFLLLTLLDFRWFQIEINVYMAALLSMTVWIGFVWFFYNYFHSLICHIYMLILLPY